LYNKSFSLASKNNHSFLEIRQIAAAYCPRMRMIYALFSDFLLPSISVAVFAPEM